MGRRVGRWVWGISLLSSSWLETHHVALTGLKASVILTTGITCVCSYAWLRQILLDCCGSTCILGLHHSPQNLTKVRVHSSPSRHKSSRDYETVFNKPIYGSQNGGKGVSQQLGCD